MYLRGYWMPRRRGERVFNCVGEGALNEGE